MENEVAKKSRVPFILAGIGVLIVAWFAWSIVIDKDMATVGMGGGVDVTVKVADNAFEQVKGLSGVQAGTLGADGMIFLFDNEQERVFTMKGMEFNLDFIWLKDGKIVRIDENIPAPAPGEDPVILSSAPLHVDMVIELPAGKVHELGYVQGNLLTVTY